MAFWGGLGCCVVLFWDALGVCGLFCVGWPKKCLLAMTGVVFVSDTQDSFSFVHFGLVWLEDGLISECDLSESV